MDKTAVKAFRVLERLAASERSRGVSDLACELGLPKSNLHRVLTTLVGLGYARQQEPGRYAATLRAWEIGVQVLNRISVQRAAGPHLEELALRSGETVHLAMRQGDEAVFIAIVESTRAVRTMTRVGERAPLHASAVGKVFLAWSPAPFEATGLARFNPATIAEPQAFAEELGRVRHRGWATNLGEWRAEVFGAAAPIQDRSGAVVAALAVSGPAERLKPASLKKVGLLVQEAARRISVELGYTAPF